MTKLCIQLFAMTLVSAMPALADPGSCPARPLRCVNHELSTLSRSGKSLIVELPAGEFSTTAILEDMTFSREQQTRVYRRLAELPCRAPEVRPNPDSSQAALICEDSRLTDAGYVVELSSPDLAGLQHARVVEHRFAGDIELENLPCGR